MFQKKFCFYIKSYRKHEENVRNMSGKSEEKPKKRALKTLITVTTPKKIFPPPEIFHQGREINLKIIGGGEKKSNLCNNIAPCIPGSWPDSGSIQRKIIVAVDIIMIL